MGGKGIVWRKIEGGNKQKGGSYAEKGSCKENVLCI